ncbi:MAG TPA: NAD-dependent malic enzyme [Actinobacteria bacterium]|nr:NAD-dependent malic enzyme [Actinomycetota bacterium]
MREVWKRGAAVLADPLLNKGTAFTPEERELFDLEGLLPTEITDRDAQVTRGFEHISTKGNNPLEKYIGMAALQDRNETLFYQVMAAHIAELIPIVYTPTVGQAALSFSHLFRRGRGLWITPDHKGRIHEILGHTRNADVRLIVVTDNERILGLGDQGAGGMVIPVGKLALYTLGAGIHPAFTLPVSLDVGTDNKALLEDPLYVGWPHPRLRGRAYDELVEEFVEAVRRRWPQALLQWEDFKKANAFRLLDRYRNVLPSFNDDIQGTGAIVAAGLLAAGRATGVKILDQRVLMVGAGAAGVGIARQIRHLVEAAGGPTDPNQYLAMFDTAGLVLADRDGLDEHKVEFAFAPAVAAPTDDLVGFIDNFHPTVLIGTTGQPGIFGEAVVQTMARHAERPLVMALSNPTSKTEGIPEEIVRCSQGRALVATGSPFDPVAYGELIVPVSQCNNVYVFPGIGMGAIVSRASKVTDAMFAAAAETLASLVSEEDLRGGALYPPIEQLRPISRAIASAVARAARDEGVGELIGDAAIEAALDAQMWDLEYPRLEPV